MKTLKRIRAAQSNFDGACLAALQDCTQLELLDLQDCNKIPVADWSTLQNFKKLKMLRLWGPTVDNSVLDFVKAASSLKILSLEATNVGADGLAKVASLPIQELLSNAPNIDTDALAHVANLKNLAKLELRNVAVGNKGMAHLAGLKELKVLDLSETAVGDKGLEHLKGADKPGGAKPDAVHHDGRRPRLFARDEKAQVAQARQVPHFTLPARST